MNQQYIPAIINFVKMTTFLKDTSTLLMNMHFCKKYSNINTPFHAYTYAETLCSVTRTF